MFNIKCLAKWLNPFGWITRELASCAPDIWCLLFYNRSLLYLCSCRRMLIPLEPSFEIKWCSSIFERLVLNVWFNCFHCANQVMIELPLFLFSSQGSTCQCEWRRGSARRTCYHVGGKKAIGLLEWVFIVRYIIWREDTFVRWLLIKGRAFLMCCLLLQRQASGDAFFCSWI